MEGSTPLDIDEMHDIKIKVFTRKELDDAEYITQILILCHSFCQYIQFREHRGMNFKTFVSM